MNKYMIYEQIYDIWTNPSKNLQNIDKNKTLRFDASVTEVEKQTHFERTAFKDMYCRPNWNLKCNKINT